MSISYRQPAAFGERTEFNVVGLMLKEGLDVYLPLVDHNAVDAVIKRPNGQFVEVQNNARSKKVIFAAMIREARKKNRFGSVFDRMDSMWIMSFKEYLEESPPNKAGKNAGKRSIWFNGKSTEANMEHVKPQFQKFVATGFIRLLYDARINSLS